MSKRFPNPSLAYLQIRSAFGIPEFPTIHMRGGSSTGIVIWKQHLPSDDTVRDELIRHLMGVPLHGERTDNWQTNGLGRGIPTSNKVFIIDVDPARRLITSTLAQLAADKSAIDWSVNCGNMSAALPLYAFDTGLLNADGEHFKVDIFNTNTNSNLSAHMTLNNANGDLLADTEISGIDGKFPGVDLYLHAPVGSKTGMLLPTGTVLDLIDGIEVSCLDVAVPMVIVAAEALGKTGYETATALDADDIFKQRLHQLRVAAGLRMGIKHPSGEPISAAQLAASETLPKICLVAAARNGGHLTTRYFTPQTAHPSLAVSGGCCLASACLIPGTVAHRIAQHTPIVTTTVATHEIIIEHPTGMLATRLEALIMYDGQIEIHRAAYRRSAQILLRGTFPIYCGSTALRAFLKEQSI